MNSIIGGYDNDCFWRCVAYLSGGGYSESDAEAYINNFYPDSGSYAEGGYSGASDEDMKRYQRENHNNISGTIIKIDPNKVPGFTGSAGATHHSVVYKRKEDNGSYVVWDPQLKIEYYIPAEALDKTYVFAGSSSESTQGSGSGSY